MSQPFLSLRVASAVMVAALSLFTGACTSSGDGDAAPTAPATSASPSGSTGAEASDVSAEPAGGTFGPDCPNFPETGEGSLQDLARLDWILALAATPALSQWSVMTTVAGLQADFAQQDDVTVFVPVDGAFRALGVERIRELLKNPPQAGDLLRYHVVTERLSPEQLPGSHPTLTGQQVQVTGSGEDFVVNGEAKIVCGNLQAANATIYLIDQVLVP